MKVMFHDNYLHSKISIIDYLKRIVDNINCDGTGGAFKERIPIIENPNCDFRSSLIKSIHFYTSTCIIERF